MAGIYLHIPFCRKACHYCDFHFSTSLKLKGDMMKALLREIELNSGYLGKEEIKTIYFGGGTPSLLQTDEINELLNKIYSSFSLSEDLEITLEANPDDLSSSKTTELKLSGINRLSIGIQSFRNEDLVLMNRAHNAEMARKSLINAREAGFENISVDLIYGIPDLTLPDWEANLNELLEFQPEHISAYGLTIEDRTAFGHRVKKGTLIPADEETTIQQFELLIQNAEKAGYEQYEISNFSLPGKISKHNSSYWKGEKYLGIGPSAHSFNGVSRRWNIRNNPLYIKSIMNGELSFEEEVLNEKDRFNELILTSLRTKWGLDVALLKQNFPIKMFDKLMEESEIYLKREQLKIVGEKIFLTEKGKLVADKITSDLFAV